MLLSTAFVALCDSASPPRRAISQLRQSRVAPLRRLSGAGPVTSLPPAIDAAVRGSSAGASAF